MAMRPLGSLEDEISKATILFAVVRQWEFAAFLETANGPLIEIRTLMRVAVASASAWVIRRGLRTTRPGSVLPAPDEALLGSTAYRAG
jgi:hypothetical protein